LLGAILENACPDEDVSTLYKALNHLSTYKLGMLETALPNSKKWHIINQ